MSTRGFAWGRWVSKETMILIFKKGEVIVLAVDFSVICWIVDRLDWFACLGNWKSKDEVESVPSCISARGNYRGCACAEVGVGNRHYPLSSG